MSLFFRPKPFVFNNEIIQLEDLEIIEYGALNDEVTVEFTLEGEWNTKDCIALEGCGSIQELQEDVERLWANDNEFIKTKRKL